MTSFLFCKGYCLCTPSLAIDAIIEIDKHDGKGEHIVLVKRRDPPSDVFGESFVITWQIYFSDNFF